MSQAPAYEAQVMKHPHARKGKITQIKGVDENSGKPFTDSHGEPDVFPDVTVKDAHTEAYYRAQGYLVPGEVPPAPAEYAEYPVMLVHPDHVDAVADDFMVEKGPNGETIRHKIPGSPEKFPPMQANDAADEEILGRKGYVRAGHDNPDAIRTAHASPHVPGRVTQEYPKMVNGEVEDPDAQIGGPIQYPKWVGEVLVNSRAEEEALTGQKVDAVLDTCIICDEVILASQPKAEGKNGSYHLSHVATEQAAAPAPVPAAAKKPVRKKTVAAPKPASSQPPIVSRRAARAQSEA